MSESVTPWIVDSYVNANPPHLDLTWSLTDNTYGSARTESQDLEQLVADMDRNGIARALIAPPPESAMGDLEAGYRWTLDAVQQHPDRFGLSVRVDADQGIRAVRHLESMVRNDGARALRIVPYRDQRRASHRSYFPLYAKCIELDIPVTVTVGMPLVQRRGIVQNPKHLDTVCRVLPRVGDRERPRRCPVDGPPGTASPDVAESPSHDLCLSAESLSARAGGVRQQPAGTPEGPVRLRLSAAHVRSSQTGAANLWDQRRSDAMVCRPERTEGLLGRRQHRGRRDVKA